MRLSSNSRSSRCRGKARHFWRKANMAMERSVIKEDLRRALEECGPKTVRIILYGGHVNTDGFPDAIRRITQSGPERKGAIEWLSMKDARGARWIKIKVATIAATLANMFSLREGKQK